MQKLYCYVDETGQDTKGVFFLVVVILLSHYEMDNLLLRLERVEKDTHKNLAKWTKTPFKVKKKYLREVLGIKSLKKSLYYSTYFDSTKYISLTVLAIAKAIEVSVIDSYVVSIVIDGLQEGEVDKVRKEIKKLKIKYKKIRGMKDEQSSILRLSDSIAGFLRDNLEKRPYTLELMKKFTEAKIIVEV